MLDTDQGPLETDSFGLTFCPDGVDYESTSEIVFPVTLLRHGAEFNAFIEEVDSVRFISEGALSDDRSVITSKFEDFAKACVKRRRTASTRERRAWIKEFVALRKRLVAGGILVYYAVHDKALEMKFDPGNFLTAGHLVLTSVESEFHECPICVDKGEGESWVFRSGPFINR